MTQIEHVCGNTFCLATPSMRIPCYRLNDAEMILLDSGLSCEGDEIEGALDHAGYRVHSILTSHAHYDHVGNHKRFKARYAAKIYETLFDAAITQTPLTLQACFYTEQPSALAAAYPYMVLSPDAIIDTRAGFVQAGGVEFELLHLPGHAHEHVGFVTPDGVAYLGDLLLSEQALQKTGLIFGHCWTEALQSIEAMRNTSFPFYILAHNAIYRDIQGIADQNLERMESHAAIVASLAEHWISRDALISAAAAHFKRNPTHLNRAHILDRILNSMIGYLEETGRVECTVRNAVIHYRQRC